VTLIKIEKEVKRNMEDDREREGEGLDKYRVQIFELYNVIFL